jgi:hypothetical protein
MGPTGRDSSRTSRRASFHSLIRFERVRKLGFAAPSPDPTRHGFALSIRSFDPRADEGFEYCFHGKWLIIIT